MLIPKQNLTKQKRGYQNKRNYRPISLRNVASKNPQWGFPGGVVVENLPANAGDTGSSPGLGRSHMPQSN